ncbi:LytTR family transcriptional regulator DNA-binding domain-containing protein [Bacteroidales bacterium OttesenSCG-928-I14]|nr:LytTR family transcriptional regulator DNA-binding domain-containing protein [Bacteroidales bacterium OttesenSCG-928-I14]
MNNPFLRDISTRLIYLAVWVILSIIQTALLGHYLSFIDNRELLTFSLVDTLAYNLFLAIGVLLLWYPITYYRNILSVPLFLLFHIVLLALILALSLGLAYLLLHYVFYQDVLFNDFFIISIPLKLFIGTTIYLISVLSYYLFLTGKEVKLQTQTVESLQEEVSEKTIEKLTRIAVKKKKEIQVIPVNEVVYIEANGDYVLIHTNTEHFLKDKTMKYWESHLPEDIFIRIHRSFIINIEYIERLDLYEKDTYRLRLKTGAVLKVSQSGYKQLKQYMQL